MEEAKIIFNDGIEITAEVNGSCYIVDTKPEFPDDLTEVVIEKDGTQETLEFAEVQECASSDGRYWFTFATATEYDKLQSQVLYTALMTDTLIEEG